MQLNRKPTRLQNYDYNQNGFYFITICTKDRQCLPTSVVGADDPGSPHIELKKSGKIVENNINKMNEIYADISVESFVIMPIHVHLLVNSSCSLKGSPRSSTPTNQISKFVAAFKKFTEKEAGFKLWQRGFHDHIIRNEEDYLYHIQYITENPTKWLIGKDEYYA